VSISGDTPHVNQALLERQADVQPSLKRHERLQVLEQEQMGMEMVHNLQAGRELGIFELEVGQVLVPVVPGEALIYKTYKNHKGPLLLSVAKFQKSLHIIHLSFIHLVHAHLLSQKLL
jgi:hypothetical protein